MIFPGFPGVLSFFQIFQVFQVEWEPCLRWWGGGGGLPSSQGRPSPTSLPRQTPHLPPKVDSPTFFPRQTPHPLKLNRQMLVKT